MSVKKTLGNSRGGGVILSNTCYLKVCFISIPQRATAHQNFIKKYRYIHTFNINLTIKAADIYLYKLFLKNRMGAF